MTLTTLVAMVGACSSVSTDRLTGAAPPTPGQGDVYLFRSAAIKAADRSFSVYVDDQPVGELANGSYLWLRLHPGGHQLKVVPGKATSGAELTVRVEPGRMAYYQYDFPTGVMSNPFFIGSVIRERSREDAVEILPTLRAARSTSGEPCESRPIDAGSIVAVDDVDAVPRLDERGRASYREWLRKAPPRAFVVAADGTAHWSWGARTIDDRQAIDAAERAIRACQANGRADCRLYAVDYRVVWEH